MVRDNRIKTLSTHSLTADANGAVSFTTATDTSNPVNGLLQAVRVVLDPSADIEIYNTSTSGTNPALTILATGTNLLFPRHAAIDEASAAITNSAVEFTLKGDINIDITNTGNASGATVELWYI